MALVVTSRSTSSETLCLSSSIQPKNSSSPPSFQKKRSLPQPYLQTKTSTCKVCAPLLNLPPSCLVRRSRFKRPQMLPSTRRPQCSFFLLQQLKRDTLVGEHAALWMLPGIPTPGQPRPWEEGRQGFQPCKYPEGRSFPALAGKRVYLASSAHCVFLASWEVEPGLYTWEGR